MRVLYLDILLLVNFCMDYIALYLAGVLCERARRVSRLLFAATLGAIYAMAAALATGNLFFQQLIGFGVALLLCAIAYGRSSGRDFLRIFITFYAVSLLLGALITVFYSVLNGYSFSFDGKERGGGVWLFLLLSALCALLIRLAGAWLARENTVKTRRVTVKLGQRMIVLEALVDSGNLLIDPLSGRRVIVVSLQAVQSFLPRELLSVLEKETPDLSLLPPTLARRIRLIPVRTLGELRLLVGILPDMISVCDAKKKNRTTRVDAILGIDTRTAGTYGGCDAVMPTSLVA